jgi:hypothetical protein
MVNKQDYLNSITQNIEMVRGDTLAFNFQLEGLEGEEPDFTFTCKETPEGEVVFNAEIGEGISLVDYDLTTDLTTYGVRIAPGKTERLDIAIYYYDLEMRLNGDVVTLMRGKLTLLYDITN